MKELYKVRNINISLLDKTTYEPLLDIPCEFGKIIDKEGIIFLETHISMKIILPSLSAMK